MPQQKPALSSQRFRKGATLAMQKQQLPTTTKHHWGGRGEPPPTLESLDFYPFPPSLWHLSLSPAQMASGKTQVGTQHFGPHLEVMDPHCCPPCSVRGVRRNPKERQSFYHHSSIMRPSQSTGSVRFHRKTKIHLRPEVMRCSFPMVSNETMWGTWTSTHTWHQRVILPFPWQHCVKGDLLKHKFYTISTVL